MQNNDSLEERRDGDDDDFVVSHHSVHVLNHVSQVVAVRSENIGSFIIVIQEMRLQSDWIEKGPIRIFYAGRRTMELKVQGRRKRGRPKRRWLDRVRDDIKEKGLSADEVYNMEAYAIVHQPHIKVGIR